MTQKEKDSLVGGSMLKSLYDNLIYNNMFITHPSIDKILNKIRDVKIRYPNADVTYDFMTTPDGKNYVVRAKENGKIVYSSYKPN